MNLPNIHRLYLFLRSKLILDNIITFTVVYTRLVSIWIRRSTSQIMVELHIVTEFIFIRVLSTEIQGPVLALN